MSTIYVARSVKLGKWGADVGLSKHVYKVGVTDEPVKSVIATGWAGETDWGLVKAEAVDDLTEVQAIERLAKKDRMVDPNLYPRIKGTLGIFKVLPAHVENHILVAKAMAGAAELGELKLKPVDFAAYLIHNATR